MTMRSPTNGVNVTMNLSDLQLQPWVVSMGFATKAVQGMKVRFGDAILSQQREFSYRLVGHIA
jgi:hypothetical protein